uniref:Fibulin 2 n=1 Tax=Oryzias latipes TaxID=8090 RepID=A0A3P9I0T0_ORYLA
MTIQKYSSFFCFVILTLDICASQKDCSGVVCPVLQNCIETVLETGACCPKCMERGCICEGYQYYDCIQVGFQNGKVPEGESYFVDFGSTECSCPQGGGKISCRFIQCPEIPPNCIDVLQPADGCSECGRIGCTHGNKKYEAGHSFRADNCQVCHCPNEGGKIMCSPIPDCDLHSVDKSIGVTTTWNSSPFRDISGGHGTSQKSLVEPFSKLALGNTLPLYKQDPPRVGSEDHDYSREEPTSSTILNLAQLVESSTLPLSYPESNATLISHGGGRNEKKQTQRKPNLVRSTEEKPSQSMNQTSAGAHTRASPTTTTKEGMATEIHRQQQELGERSTRHNNGRNSEMQDPARDSSHGTRTRTGLRSFEQHNRGQSSSNRGQLHSAIPPRQEKGSEKPNHMPDVQFGSTERASIRINEDSEDPQTFITHRSSVAENSNLSAKELMKTCCETGEKWASANGHCNNMEPPTKDRQSICWTAQQQCCLGSLTEAQCLAGINAARAGGTCREGASTKCGIYSYKDCCGCCSLGLQFRKEGHACEAHHSLGYHCQHIFLTCCEGKEIKPTIRERPALDTTSAPRKVSDGLFPREAFSMGEDRDGENAVEGPVEVEDMDECLIYKGRICHHSCVNTPGSYRCECFPGYVLQEDAITCAQDLVEEENRLKEIDRTAVKNTSPPLPPILPAVPINPCEGNICEQQCTLVAGRPQCSCSLGFSLKADGRSCEDVNECLSSNACLLNEPCMNTQGSYICQRLITCLPGQQINDDVCEDIDECAQRSHNCAVDSECVNTQGSFRCSPKARCAGGFIKDTQGNCVDIDECGTLTQTCNPRSSCINTVGSYICNRRIICSRGYHASPNGSRCVDVNECESSLHQCGDGQLCVNLPGSYRCECQAGYQYDSFRRMCTDINECWRYPGRLCAQTCVNTPGSYECSCTSGFRLSGDSKNCEDVNECLANPCSQECANIYGSYQCYCRQGYYLREDGKTCDDIDECSRSIGPLCTYKCVNVPGSYRCACPEYGYTMSSNGRSCIDIDECAAGVHNCSLADTCYNIQGSYRCLSLSCPQNYRKVSDTRCERISCPNYLECQNSPLRITYYYLSFQSNIVIPAQIFRIGPSPAYSGDNVIVTITQGNEENYFSTRKVNAYTGAVFLQRQVQGPRDFLITVEMKLWRQGVFTTFQARIYVFITANLL